MNKDISKLIELNDLVSLSFKYQIRLKHLLMIYQEVVI